MTDAELLELVTKVLQGRPDARDALFGLLKDLMTRVSDLEEAAE